MRPGAFVVVVVIVADFVLGSCNSFAATVVIASCASDLSVHVSEWSRARTIKSIERREKKKSETCLKLTFENGRSCCVDSVRSIRYLVLSLFKHPNEY